LGAAVGVAASGARPLEERWGPWREAAVLAVMAQAPDLDFLPGILLGNPSLYHHGASHSLGAAVLFAGLCWLWGWRRGRPWRWALVGGALYLAQVVADAWTVDTRPPFGVPFWWPLSPEFFYPEHPLFYKVIRDVSYPGWLAHDLKAVALEVAVFGPMLAASWVWRRWRNRRGASGANDRGAS
jgi:inner membrane protein